jgi:hypothetical protein
VASPLRIDVWVDFMVVIKRLDLPIPAQKKESNDEGN